MAGYSGKNVSRDFWRFTSIPVATCLNLISLRLCFPVWVLLSFGEVLINSIVLSLCLPRAFYCVNVSVCKERVTLKVPLKSKTISGGYELANVEVVDPISMISFLWNDIGIRIGQDEVEQYWDHHRKFGARWALHSRASRQTMPLGLYGDSVKVRSTYLWLEKMVGIFLNCPLYRPRSCRCAKWLLFACQEELLYANHSLDCVYGFLTWSLNQLFTGRYPVRGFNGAALSTKGVQMAGKWICNDRWTFQITEIRGDWSWHKFVFRFKSSWKGGAKLPICFKCKSFAVGAPHELYYNIEENSPCWQKRTHKRSRVHCWPMPRSTMPTSCTNHVFLGNFTTFVVTVKTSVRLSWHCLTEVLWYASAIFITIWSGGVACMPSIWGSAMVQMVERWSY